MLLVIIHHAIIVAIAMLIMSRLVWSAQTQHRADSATIATMGVYPRWIKCYASGSPPKRRKVNAFIPSVATAAVAAFCCLVFILGKAFQSQLWFNLLLDSLVSVIGVTFTHIFRYFDPKPVKEEDKKDPTKNIYTEAGPSHLVFGLFCGVAGAVLASFVQSGSNLAICLAALGCGHAGLLIKLPPSGFELPSESEEPVDEETIDEDPTLTPVNM
jgi:hypothetical protein